MIADVVVVLTAFLAGGALVALVQHLRSFGGAFDVDRLCRERDAAQRAADRRLGLLRDLATALDVDVASYRAATGLGCAYDLIDAAEMLAGACRWKAEQLVAEIASLLCPHCGDPKGSHSEDGLCLLCPTYGKERTLDGVGSAQKSSPLREWVSTQCEPCEPGEGATLEELHAAYKNWSENVDRDRAVPTPIVLASSLRSMGRRRAQRMVEGRRNRRWDLKLISHPPAVDHELKTWPAYLDEVWQGRKTLDLRPDDRSFEAGQVLRLRDWHPGPGTWGGRSILVRVTHVLRDVPHFGLAPGYCALSIRVLQREGRDMTCSRCRIGPAGDCGQDCQAASGLDQVSTSPI